MERKHIDQSVDNGIIVCRRATIEDLHRNDIVSYGITNNKEYERNACHTGFHLVELYNVETRALKQAVKRNKERFPSDFMIELTKNEWIELITNCDKLPENMKHNPTPPAGFSEQGVAMLSLVLRSKTAIEVNISNYACFCCNTQVFVGLFFYFFGNRRIMEAS